MAEELRSPIGLVAGSGELPIRFAARAKSLGLKVIAVAHKGESSRNISSLVDSCLWVRLGELQKMIAFLKGEGVSQAAFAGGIRRVSTFGRMHLDARAKKLLPRLSALTDDSLLRGIAGEFEFDGIRIISATQIFAGEEPAGVLTKRRPTADEIRDAKVGWAAARAAGSVDIGQTVVVVQGVVAAVEAVEGTDKTILRAGKLAGKGGVVVKLCKSGQDLRFDLPTIGPGTIRSMKKAGASCLVLEAGKSLILDREKLIKDADRLNIAIVSCSSPDEIA